MTHDPPERAEVSVLHVDMDCFFAAVEIADDPALRGRPVVVGGTGDRGVVAACSYEARLFGIGSAMPTVQARRLCPAAVFLPGRHSRYSEVSGMLMEILRSVTPLVEPVSVDEAYLDVSSSRRRGHTAGAVAANLRRHIARELGLGSSIGVARTKSLAKLASRAAKPRVLPGDGVTAPRWPGRLVPGSGVVTVEQIDELGFLHPLPAGSLGGVGPATRRRLESLGVETVGDLARVPLASIVAALGATSGRQLHDLAWARDGRPVRSASATKSLGHEETYATDVRDPETVESEVMRLSDAVATRMASAGVAARTVNVKVRYSDFDTVTRSSTPVRPLVTATAVARAAVPLAASLGVRTGVRLVGVSASNFVPLPDLGVQLALDLREPTGPGGGGPGGGGASDLRASDAWDAVCAVRSRFGEAAIGPARLAQAGRLRVRLRGEAPWGPSVPAAGA